MSTSSKYRGHDCTSCEKCKRIQRCAVPATALRPQVFGPCPLCGKTMEYGDEFPEERCCDACAAAYVKNHTAAIKRARKAVR